MAVLGYLYGAPLSDEEKRLVRRLARRLGAALAKLHPDEEPAHG